MLECPIIDPSLALNLPIPLQTKMDMTQLQILKITPLPPSLLSPLPFDLLATQFITSCNLGKLLRLICQYVPSSLMYTIIR